MQNNYALLPEYQVACKNSTPWSHPPENVTFVVVVLVLHAM